MLNHACYHRLTILNNHQEVHIRFRKKQDRDDLMKFCKQTSQEDLPCRKEEVKHAKGVEARPAPENSSRTITLTVQEMEAKLPLALLNLYRDPKHSLTAGEIRQILLIVPFQGQGSGARMLDELIALAAQEKLCWLKVAGTAEWKPVIQAFQSKDFKVRAIFEDYLTDSTGKRHDVALMMRQVQYRAEDFLPELKSTGNANLTAF